MIERIQHAAGPGADHLPAGVPAALDRPGARHRADHDPSRPAAGGAIWSRGSRATSRCRPRSSSRSWRATDGVPLFVEELTKTVLESGLLADAGDRYELTGPLPPLAIPTTLHNSLIARLDRLAPVKEIAQIGAAIGREFSHALLAAVADRPDAELQIRARPAGRRRADLPSRHAARGHLQLQARPGPGRRLRHPAQVHAASSCTPASHRCSRSTFRRPRETQPELLAHHCTQAGLVEQAVDYWHRAGAPGDGALGDGRSSRPADARPWICSQRCPKRAIGADKELDLQIALGRGPDRHQGLGGAGGGESLQRELGAVRGDGPMTRSSSPCWRGCSSTTCTGPASSSPSQIAADLLRLAEQTQDRSARAVGAPRLGRRPTVQWAAAPSDRRTSSESLALYDPAESQRRPCYLCGADEPGGGASCSSR